MAYVRTTEGGSYLEFDGGARRSVTLLGEIIEFYAGTYLRNTETGAYVEQTPDAKVRASDVVAYVEISATDVEVVQVFAYVEITPTAVGSLTPNPPDTVDDAQVDYIKGIVGQEARDTLVNQVMAYAELVDHHLYVTKFITLFEASGDDLRVTKFINLIELEYDADLGNGMIIIGKHKTWRDSLQKIITDIPMLQAYNFIISTNGMYMLELEWDDVEDEDGYEIERSDDGLTGWTLMHVTDPDVTKYISISLTPNTTYYFRIRSFNEGGYSAYSDVVDETTKKVGAHLLDRTGAANLTSNPIYVRTPMVTIGDYMLMQIGIEDVDKINLPDGWSLEATIPGVYTNLILSKTASGSEPPYYTITRNGSETPIVTVSIFAWDAQDDTIIFFDG